MNNLIEKTIKTSAQSLSFTAHNGRDAVSILPLFYDSSNRFDMIKHAIKNFAGQKIEPSLRALLSASEQQTEQQGFMGMAHAQSKKMMGLKISNEFVAVIGLNTDLIKSVSEAELLLYHSFSHALDCYANAVMREQNLSAADFILLPKRNQLLSARSNLKADLFASFLMPHSEQSPPHFIAEHRCETSLNAQIYQRPEDYPFALALDISLLASEKIKKSNDNKVLEAHDLAGRVTQTFDKTALASWVGFAAPAQNLAWSGHSPEIILGLCIHTSSNPLIKANGHLVADILNLTPQTNSEASGGYNPYLGRASNHIFHQQKVDKVFEVALVSALEQKSAAPLIQTAHEQNTQLLKGEMFGWCAHALQAAGDAFNRAHARGSSPATASRMMFEGRKTLPDWNGLQDLNTFVNAQRRQGFGVTLQDVAVWCKRHTGMEVVVEAVENTIKDPVFAQGLALVNSMPQPPTTRPAYAAGLNVAPQAPQPSFAAQPQMPSMNGGGMGMMGGGGMMGARSHVSLQRQKNTAVDEKTSQ